MRRCQPVCKVIYMFIKMSIRSLISSIEYRRWYIIKKIQSLEPPVSNPIYIILHSPQKPSRFFLSTESKEQKGKWGAKYFFPPQIPIQAHISSLIIPAITQLITRKPWAMVQRLYAIEHSRKYDYNSPQPNIIFFFWE